MLSNCNEASAGGIVGAAAPAPGNVSAAAAAADAAAAAAAAAAASAAAAAAPGNASAAAPGNVSAAAADAVAAAPADADDAAAGELHEKHWQHPNLGGAWELPIQTCLVEIANLHSMQSCNMRGKQGQGSMWCERMLQ